MQNNSFKPFLAYSASAGSGKTFALAVRYISLLFMGESPASILAATFTNKAAAEMRQRVVDSLRNLERDEAFLGAISDQTGMNWEMLLSRQPEVLGRFLASSAYIVTLDSFFVAILRSASLEMGLEPDFVTKEQGTEDLETLFLQEVETDGKLSSLVKLAMDIEDKRFKKIFAQLQDFYKIDPLLPEEAPVPFSLAQQETEVEALRIRMIRTLEGAGSAKRCMDQFETNSVKELFSKNLFEKERLGEHSWFKKSINEETEVVYAELKTALAKWAKAKEVLVLHNLFKIYDHYKNATIANAKASGVLSFDDLSYFTFRLLHESISKEFLYFKIDSRFKHILLDEFQDTSTLQFLLLQPLIDEIFAGEGQSEFKSFFYVGDTKQSLYRFRGGVEELFEKVAERYGIVIEPMDTNYRSARHVVEQVNRWFELVMEGYVPQKSRPGVRDGYVEVLETDSPVDDAVIQVQKLLALGVDLDDVAFLVHTNKEGQMVQEACEQAGIDTLLQTSSSLKSLPKIAALTAMCSYLYYGERIDAEAMLKRVGKSLEVFDGSWYRPEMNPLEVLDRLIRDLGYFEADKNLLKLLEFAGAYSNMAVFLEEFEYSSIPVAAHSVHGAKIMTIHGSKGLEFKYVIVLDRVSRPSSDSSPLIYHYNEALYVEKILYRTKGRENFDTQYDTILRARKRAAQKDRMNVLYVALTRAVEGLIVLRKENGSVFDAVGISPMKRGEIELQRPAAVEESPIQEKMVILTHYGTQEIAVQEESEEKDYQAILFGTALHYTLEMMHGLNNESLENAMNAMRNRYGVQFNSFQTDQIRKRILMLLENRTFQDLLKDAEISKEVPISFEGELKQIDLLLTYETRCVVVDYKSSKKERLKHEKQVNYYCKAIEKITNKETKGVILYLLEEGIEIKNLK